jgi:hypothetical protein
MPLQATNSVSSAVSQFKTWAEKQWQKVDVKMITHMAIGILMAGGAVAAAVLALPATAVLGAATVVVLCLGAICNGIQAVRHYTAHSARVLKEPEQLELT